MSIVYRIEKKKIVRSQVDLIKFIVNIVKAANNCDDDQFR